MKRYLFAMKFIFKHIFGHFFENEWKGQNTILSSTRKKYVFILRKFKCSIFLYQQYYASSNVSTISQPPPWHYLLLLFPVVVNSYVKPIGPLLSPLFLQKSNPIDFQDRSICWSVVTPFLKLSETFEKDWTGHLPKGHLILIWEAFWESPQKETLRLLKSGIRRCNTHLFLISLAHGETKRIYFHDQTVTKKSLVPFFPDHSLFSPSLM